MKDKDVEVEYKTHPCGCVTRVDYKNKQIVQIKECPFPDCGNNQNDQQVRRCCGGR